MTLSLSFLITIILFLLGSVSSRFIVEKNSIRVISPHHIRGHHDAAIANFGVPNYGGTLIGVVIYPDKNSNACEKFETTYKTKSRRPVILLLDRGECYFALKSWHAQNSGAAAVLVTDNIDEPLLTMDTPDDSMIPDSQNYVEKISIPSTLIEKSFGETLKATLQKLATDKSSGDELIVKIDWRESMPHPDERVEYEFWTNSNDECGERCDEQIEFVKSFRGHAQLLERGGFARFTPHYITWFCPEAFRLSRQCKSQCINNGRYCAPDPEQDFGSGYEGKDVVIENLRQLCVHRVANRTGRPWQWWDFVVDYDTRCSMKERKYSQDCAETVVKSLGISLDEVSKCMGDPAADVENAVLKKEQEDQVGHDSRGDVTFLPTLVINNVQYRGKLERTAVLKAVCAGFKESTEPHVCLSSDIETNECLHKNGGCWRDPHLNVTACKDTYRGRLCECPSINGVEYEGDGYTFCTAVGPARCSADNGGCWSETRNGLSFSACSESSLRGCTCPPGFHGDGYKCQDTDECKEKLACSCPECSCKNKWGGYDCKCKGNLLYIKGEDVCVARSMSMVSWLVIILVLSCIVGAGIAGYIFYRYRLRSYMDSEIVAIMSQYMPLDSRHNENQPLRENS